MLFLFSFFFLGFGFDVIWKLPLAVHYMKISLVKGSSLYVYGTI